MSGKRHLMITLIVLFCCTGLAAGQFYLPTIYLEGDSSQNYESGDPVNFNLGLTLENITSYSTGVTYNPEYVEFVGVKNTSDLSLEITEYNGSVYIKGSSSSPVSSTTLSNLQFKVRDEIPKSSSSYSTVEFELIESSASVNGDQVDLTKQGASIEIKNEEEDSQTNNLSDVDIEIQQYESIDEGESTKIEAYAYSSEDVNEIEFDLVVDKNNDDKYSESPVDSKVTDVSSSSLGNSIAFELDSSLKPGKYTYKVIAEKGSQQISSYNTGVLVINSSEPKTGNISNLKIELPSKIELSEGDRTNIKSYLSYQGVPINDTTFKLVIDSDGDQVYDDEDPISKKVAPVNSDSESLVFNNIGSSLDSGTYSYKVFAQKGTKQVSSYTSSNLVVKSQSDISDVGIEIESSKKVTRGSSTTVTSNPIYNKSNLLTNVNFKLVVDKDGDQVYGDEEPVDEFVTNLSTSTYKVDLEYNNINLKEGSYNYKVFAQKGTKQVESYSSGKLSVSDKSSDNYSVNLDYESYNTYTSDGDEVSVYMSTKGSDITGYLSSIDYNSNYLELTGLSGSGQFTKPDEVQDSGSVQLTANQSQPVDDPDLVELKFEVTNPTPSLPLSKVTTIEVIDSTIYSDNEPIQSVDLDEVNIQLKSNSTYKDDTQDEDDSTNQTEEEFDENQSTDDTEDEQFNDNQSFTNDTEDEFVENQTNDTEDEQFNNNQSFTNDTEDEFVENQTNDTEDEQFNNNQSFTNDTEDEFVENQTNDTEDEQFNDNQSFTNNTENNSVESDNSTGSVDPIVNVSENTSNQTQPEVNRSVVETVIELFVQQNNVDSYDNNTTENKTNDAEAQNQNSTENETSDNSSGSSNSTIMEIISSIFG